MGGRPRLDTAEFIRRAQARHGVKCDYSQAVYIDYKTPLQITCRQCGSTYFQAPLNHLKTDGHGWGCKICGRRTADIARAKKLRGRPSKLRKTTAQFIKDAVARHGKKVDYSKVQYKTAWTPVVLICNVCSYKYSQTPHSHLRKSGSKGWGCPKCNLAARIRGSVNARKGKPAKNRKPTGTFIFESKTRHGEHAYDYSKCRYLGAHHAVMLRCNTCKKWFKQLPTNHLRKGGCIFCSYEDRGERHRSSFDDFVERSRSVHGKKHRYFRDTYSTTTQNTKVLCLEHKYEFWQAPNNHLAGKTGCTYCQRISDAEEKIAIWLEANKIGYEPQKRFKTCRDKAILPFDFLVPSQLLLIEYDGEHHYKEFYTPLHEVQRRDAIKTKWAEDNGYSLLRIPYWDRDKIPRILREHLRK